MRYMIVIALLVFVLAGCTNADPKYTVFVDDQVLVLSGSPRLTIEEQDGQGYVVPNDAIAVYGWVENSSSDSREIVHYEPGTKVSYDHIKHIVYPWNGTSPNITQGTYDAFVANAPGATRLANEPYRIVSPVPTVDLEGFLKSTVEWRAPPIASRPEPSPGYLGRTNVPIELEHASTRWQLIRPAEYLLLFVISLLLLMIIISPAFAIRPIPEERVLLLVPIILTTIGVAYSAVALMLAITRVWFRTLGDLAQPIILAGGIIGFLVGPIGVWKRFGARKALISTVITLGIVTLIVSVLYGAYRSSFTIF